MAIARQLFARGAVHLVALDPTKGGEIRKTRPCLIVSPNELNQSLRTVVVAPMTTGGHTYPWRVPCRFQRRIGYVAVDRLRTVDTERLVKRLGKLDPETVSEVLRVLQEMFAE
jgi:mRNA interferase MazF